MLLMLRINVMYLQDNYIEFGIPQRDVAVIVCVQFFVLSHTLVCVHLLRMSDTCF